jgi:DNA-binding CsgD family transcriptional regulator
VSDTGQAISATIDDLYEGVLDDSAWGRALVRMADLAGGSGVQLIAFNAVTGNLVRDEAHRMDPWVLQEYRRSWGTRDVLVPAAMGVAVGRCTPEHVMMDPREYKRSAMFNDFMYPADCPHVLVTWLHKSSHRLAALSIKSTRRHGPFSDLEVRTLERVIPHARRALEIRDRLQACRIRADALLASLQRLPFGMLILDDMGRVIESNTFAEQMLRVEPGVRCGRDRMLWLQGRAGVELRRWIAIGQPSTSHPDGIFHVERGKARTPISILVSPLPNVPASWISAVPRYLILLFDPEERLAPVAEMLSAELGITAKEAELCALLSTGLDLQVCAGRLGIRPNTARNHLKSIFGKTGTHSQSELMRRLLTGVAAQVRSSP